MFYYSGHAMQYNGVNYLMPIDAMLTDEADLKRFVRVDDIVNDLQQAKNLRILVLDSCRDNPLAETLKRSAGATRAASIGRGLSKIEAPRGTIVSFSTQSGQVARRRHRPQQPLHDGVPEAHRAAARDRRRLSRHQQRRLRFERQDPAPGAVAVDHRQVLSERTGRDHGRPTAPQPTPRPDPCAAAEAHWKAAESIGNASAFEDHLARFSSCSFAGLAKARIEGLKQKTVLAPASDAARASGTKAFDGNWDVTLNCPTSGKAQGFTRALAATVTNGVFHAEGQNPGGSNRLEIDGQIPADGKTTLSARGTTGASAYTLNNLAPGSPYAFTIDAQFERSRGSGKRNEARACNLVFVKR